MTDMEFSGLADWLRSWFYLKTEVYSQNEIDDLLEIIDNGSINITNTNLFSTMDCVNNNFDDLSNGNYTLLLQ